MQSICSTGRLLTRALLNGFASNYPVTESGSNTNVTSSKPSLTTVWCGFPKERLRRLVKGKIGDDAWFVAQSKHADILGVADGVGGWRQYGIDPGEFSSFLMRTCERLVHTGQFSASDPLKLIARSYCELLQHKKPILGSSTACVLILNREDNRLYTANIGDSGYMILRNGNLIKRSSEQQHYFNTPYQLSFPPPGHRVLSDRPESADTDNFAVQDGDVILMATDGLFDNVPEELLILELKKLVGDNSQTTLQAVANSIAWIARTLALNPTFMSPFARNARDNGIHTVGGKPDDITVLLATVTS